MKVILLKQVPKLGRADDLIEVPDGYAANALFPKKLAIPATAQAVEALKRKQQNKAAGIQIQHDLLDRAISELQGKSFTYKAKANDKGILFSKVDEKELSKAVMAEFRLSLDAKCMAIVGGPIKQTGEYVVKVTDGSYRSEFTVRVVSEK